MSRVNFQKKKKMQSNNIENIPNKVKALMINIHNSNSIDDEVVKYKRTVAILNLKEQQ